VNEPVANACRTCGRWPSLFELEGSTLETDEPVTYDEADEFAGQTIEVEVAEPEPFETDGAPELPPEFEPVDEDAEQPKPIWQRLFSLIVPIGVVLYILISALVDR
jgi:hypothetical protein